MNKSLFTFLFTFATFISVFGKEIEWPSGWTFRSDRINTFVNANGIDSDGDGLKELTIHISKPIDFEVISTDENKIAIVHRGITLKFSQGGKIVFGLAGRLKIDGNIDAGPQQIFVVQNFTDLNGNIIFEKTKFFYPEWWGYFPNEQKNWSNFVVQREIMLDIRSSGGGHLHFSAGTYYLRDLIIDFDNVVISGEGKSTILKYDVTVDGMNATTSSTRFGTFIGIMGPMRERGGGTTTGNFPWPGSEKQINNIVFRDLSVEYDDEKSSGTYPICNQPDKFDHTMNGITVGNAKNVLIENVFINLNGALRAFFIESYYGEERTENVTIRNCNTINCVTGVFIVGGYENEYLQIQRQNKTVNNILVENCNFNLRRGDYFLFNQAGHFSNGLYIAGSTFTTESRNYLGKVTFRNNLVENADFGVKTGGPVLAEEKYNHILSIENNSFRNFKVCGIQATVSRANISNNVFDSKVMESVKAETFNEETCAFHILSTELNEFENAAIHVSKGNTIEHTGLDFLNIKGNIFKNLSRSDLSQLPHTILVEPENDALTNIETNYFSYENDILPGHDIYFIVNNLSGHLSYNNNKFHNRPTNDYNFIQGSNPNFTIKELGNNYKDGN